MDKKTDTGCSSPECTSDNTTCMSSPPPYTEEPPPYTKTMEYNIYNYPNSHGDSVNMGQSSAPNEFSPPPPETLHYPNQINPPMINPQVLQQPVIIQQANYPPTVVASSPTPMAPHKALLQPNPSKIIETTVTGRRKTESHVTDLQTGKEYIIREKTSRLGLRTKAVIQEVGGPRTLVKETPRRTVIRQRKY